MSKQEEYKQYFKEPAKRYENTIFTIIFGICVFVFFGAIIYGFIKIILILTNGG